MNALPLIQSLQWEPEEKRLQSGDTFWFLTDTYTEFSSFYPNSPTQQWFRVGALNLTTGRIGYVRFSIDDARAILRAGLPPPPWGAPLPQGLEVKRLAHPGQEKGRFKVEIRLLDLDDGITWIGPAGRHEFHRVGFRPNATWGMWQKLASRVVLEQAIETTALSMVGRFSAGDLKKALGQDVNVGPVLARLVDEKRLLPSGKKKGARYEVAPPNLPDRTDWTG